MAGEDGRFGRESIEYVRAELRQVEEGALAGGFEDQVRVRIARARWALDEAEASLLEEEERAWQAFLAEHPELTRDPSSLPGN